jgi:DNA-binding CsgD family transcriptional regulator
VDAAWLASALEASADLATLARLMVRLRHVDARADLPLVSAPTLVLHREGDAVVQAHLGRHLASMVPGAAFVGLPGRAHLLYEGDPEPVLGALVRFFAADGAAEPGPVETALSRRELEVVRMVTLGLTNAEIGGRLGICRRTVDAHMEHVRAKLGIRSRAHIAAWAVHNRLAVDADGRAT